MYGRSAVEGFSAVLGLGFSAVLGVFSALVAVGGTPQEEN